MSSYAASSVTSPNMASFSVEYLSTPSRYNRGGEGTDPDTDSSSPGNNTSGGSPNLLLALSGEDAVESPPLKARSLPPSRRPLVSSPSDLEEDATHVNDSSSSTPNSSEDKPSQSYIALISMAILQHPQKKMLLGDIYQFIMDTFAHYRNCADKAWRNSIRHNLSINECFIKAGRADNGKGNYWAIHPACEEDFSKGDFRRRQARRRARRSQQVNVSKMPLTYRYSLGYVPMKSSPASGTPASVSSAAAAPGPARGGYGGARAHPYGPSAHHQHQHHQQHYQQLQSGAYGRLETSPPAYHHHHPQHHMATGTITDYTNSQYYSALTNACLSLSQPPTSSPPTSSSSYTSTPTSRVTSLQAYPGTSSSTTSPTLLTASYLQPSSLSPVSPHESSSNLLELGSSYHPSSTTMQHQQQQNNQHYPSPPQGRSLSSYPTASCVYQTQGVSPPGYGSSPPSTTTSPITIAPAGGLYGGAYSGLPLCFQDMPALRDAINGLAGISS